MNQGSQELLNVNKRLRTIRQSKGLSLLDVESLSHGRIKAVVLGSYERGSRSMSVKKALEIAEVLQVPVTSFFNDKKANSGAGNFTASDTRLILDLRAISKKAVTVVDGMRESFELLVKFTRGVVNARQDWNGEVISLRDVDIRMLAHILETDKDSLISWLDTEKVVLRKRT